MIIGTYCAAVAYYNWRNTNNIFFFFAIVTAKHQVSNLLVQSLKEKKCVMSSLDGNNRYTRSRFSM